MFLKGKLCLYSNTYISLTVEGGIDTLSIFFSVAGHHIPNNAVAENGGQGFPTLGSRLTHGEKGKDLICRAQLYIMLFFILYLQIIGYPTKQ